MFTEIIAVYSENHMKPIRGQNVEVLRAETKGT
jgi:hypothetical protein